MKNLPTGTVTFLFTDIEGSTTLLQRLGDRRYAEVLEEHRRLLRAAFEKGNGQGVDTQGDAFLVVFYRARDAVATAVAAQRALTEHPWPEDATLRVRMGLHTGEPIGESGNYVGLDVHRAARIGAAGHGGQILLSDAVGALAARDLPPGVSLRDLGSHRLKDLREPEHLLQVVHPDLPADFPPVKSLDVLSNNFPRQLTSFIGREKEIAEVKRLLSTAYLVTLTGPGGAGKTRLALQVGADLLDKYPDGVWFVELAPLSDPALVAKAVASALDVPEQPGRQLQETLVCSLPPKHLLLVLDNCEHVLSACQDLADTLLRACPHLRILATSREAVGVDGEVTYSVPSLQLPDLHRLPPLATLVEYEAVRLFADRAALSQPGFALTASNAASVAQICHRLDGIPLAIEFAAARVKVLSVDQIGGRLDDRFRLLTAGARKTLPRHQTLRATMDWSYDLLSEQEQAVLRRLSVFAGGWTLEAAEAICSGDGVEASDIFDLLTRVADKSLVSVDTEDGEARYRLLETVRQYGRDKLHEAGETGDVLRRHRDWYLQLAERGEAEQWGPTQGAWLDRLEGEHDNLRAALEWSAAESSGDEAGLRLAGALWWFWFVRCHWTEGRTWLERGRTSKASDAVLAKALVGAGFLAWRQGDYQGAVRLSEESLAVFQRLQDVRGIALSLHNLGLTARFRDDYAQAVAQGEESLALFESVRNEWGMGLALVLLGSATRGQGDYERASHLLVRAVALFRKTGDTWNISRALQELAHTVRRAGEDQRAKALYEECLPLFRDLEDNRGIGFTLLGLGQLAHRRADHERARDLGEEALALFREVGDPRGIPASTLLLMWVALGQGDHVQARKLGEESLGVFRRIGNREGIAMSLEGLSELAHTQGDYECVARLLAAIDTYRERVGIPRPAPDQTWYGQRVASARALLGEQVFDTAWVEGRAMTLEQAIEYALRETE